MTTTMINYTIAVALTQLGRKDDAWEPRTQCPQGHPNWDTECGGPYLEIGDPCLTCRRDGIPEDQARIEAVPRNFVGDSDALWYAVRTWVDAAPTQRRVTVTSTTQNRWMATVSDLPAGSQPGWQQVATNKSPTIALAVALAKGLALTGGSPANPSSSM